MRRWVRPGPRDERRSGRRGAMAGLVRMATLGVALLLPIPPAGACPVCDRETGRRVRAGLFDEDFAPNLLATLLPFGVFLGIAAALHFGPPGGKARASATAPGP